MKRSSPRQSPKRPGARPQKARAKARPRTKRRLHESEAFALDNLDRGAERKRADAALHESEARFRALTELSADWYWEQDRQFRYTFFSSLFQEKTGHAQHALLGKLRWDTPRLNLGEADWARHRQQLERHEPFYNFEMHRRDADGRDQWITVSGIPIFDASGRFTGYRGITRDITPKKVAEQALRESEARFRDLTALSSDWYWEQDEELRFTYISSETSDQADHGSASSLGKRRWELPEATPESGDWSEHRALLEARMPFHEFNVRRVKPDGLVMHFALSGAPIFDEMKRFKGYRGVGRDVTERRTAEERIRYLATHDGLTGLPNRGMFSQLLNLAIEAARRYERKFAVLFIDLDRFKYVNDNFGHEAGDELLKQMSQRFKESLRASDVVARLGGDEFVVMLQEVKQPQDAAAAARKVLSAAIKPVQVLGHECRVTASVGICLYPADAPDEQTLMKNADLAMYQAKEEGKNNYQFYSRESNTKSLEKISVETQLRQALERNELSLHYQGKRDLKSGAITGVEALLRWQNAVLGAVTPTQFIPIAEETGLIVPIGRWVLSTACAQNVAWQKEGLPAICMAVNLSPRQFSDPDLLSDIARVLESTGLAPALLELEITESMVIHDPGKAVKLLQAIKKLGVRLAIDDFGTGFSSLAQLKNFPIDTLKVDRSFIREIPNDTEDKAITEEIIVIGKTLGMTVIAEGVETKEQEEFLRRHACDEMQGFFFSKPIPAQQFAELLGTHQPHRPADADPGVAQEELGAPEN